MPDHQFFLPTVPGRAKQPRVRGDRSEEAALYQLDRVATEAALPMVVMHYRFVKFVCPQSLETTKTGLFGRLRLWIVMPMKQAYRRLSAWMLAPISYPLQARHVDNEPDRAFGDR